MWTPELKIHTSCVCVWQTIFLCMFFFSLSTARCFVQRFRWNGLYMQRVWLLRHSVRCKRQWWTRQPYHICVVSTLSYTLGIYRHFHFHSVSFLSIACICRCCFFFRPNVATRSHRTIMSMFHRIWQMLRIQTIFGLNNVNSCKVIIFFTIV